MRVEQVVIPLVRQVANRPWLSRQMNRFDRWGDPLSVEASKDPYPMFDRMRADGPVAYSKLYQQWFVTGYAEARALLSSSDVGVADQIDLLHSVRPYSKLSPRSRRFMATWLLFIDPPDHGRLRRLVSKAFTPRRIRDMEPAVVDLVEQVLDDLPSTGGFEVMERFCARIPVAVIAHLLGLPEDRWEWSRRTTAEFVKLTNPFENFDPVAMDRTVDDIFDYYGSLADERRADPRDDLITALALAEDNGDRLSSLEVITMIAFLLGAGHETTTHLLGLSLYHLANNPDQRDRVVGNPDLWPNAVEELIRFDSSAKVTPRATLADVEIGGVTVPAGANVLVELLAANRDPRRFDRPNQLRLDRDDPSPLSFGHGIHHCLGHALARMELRVGLQRFLDRYPGYTVVESEVEWRRSVSFRGMHRMTIVP